MVQDDRGQDIKGASTGDIQQRFIIQLLEALPKQPGRADQHRVENAQAAKRLAVEIAVIGGLLPCQFGYTGRKLLQETFEGLFQAVK